MSHRVKVNQPNLPDGAEVEVLHLGVVENGSTITVDDDAVRHFVLESGQEWPEGELLVLDHSAAVEDQKEALAELKEADPDAAKELQADIKEQKETLIEAPATTKKGGK